MGPEKRGKVPFISKIAYGMGDVGCNFSWMFVGNFLMIFYTDVFGIGMSAVATLMLVARIWDAVNLSDKTKSRWGRFRPWLLFGAPFTALVLMLTFWAHPEWSQTAKIIYMAVTYCILVTGYTCVNLPYGTLCGAMTQDIDERATLNTSRSVSAMIAIGVINIITVPLIEYFGEGDVKNGYLTVAILYGIIFAACHLFCFSKTREVVTIPPGQKLPLKVQLQSVMKSANLFSFYSMVIIVPSIIGAACFPMVFRWTQNKGWTAAIFSALTGLTMIMLYFFSPNGSAVPFYIFAALSQFFFSGFNTAIYAIIPDCVEYGEWKTGIRNDGFQYAFVSLGNKIGMALGTSLLAAALGSAGYVANAIQNEAVISVMRHAFSTIPGVLWILTAGCLVFYRLNKKTYNQIVAELEKSKANKLNN